MKQKNLVLIAVAVGCGLVAAVLTAQMSGGQQAPVEMVEIPIATKAIGVNTVLVGDSMKTMVALRPVDKKTLPPKVITSLDQLKDKRLVRAKIEGETFVEADVSATGTVNLPAGHNMFTIRLTQDEGVGGWAVPGQRVDIIATVEGNVFPLFKNMLIMAIGTSSQPPVNGAMPQIDNVSLAMLPRQTELLALAMSDNAKFRMALRNPETTAEDDAKAYRWNPTLEQLFTAFETKKFGIQKDTAKTPDKQEFVVVKSPVPTEDLPAGTKLTKELIAQKFTVIPITPPAPANVIEDIRSHEGEYLLKDLAASQFIPPSFLAESLPTQPETPKNAKPGPDDLAAGPKSAPVIPQAERAAPPVYHDVNVVTNAGVRTFRYEMQKGGAFIYLGEVRPGTKPAAGEDEHEKSNKPMSPRV
ncbi:MAG: Flp pilus assembly protein CpaB [Bacteroidales bacterium]|nr:Flp pilus assembly protein CpaB [Bacteroidales bacterium]